MSLIHIYKMFCRFGVYVLALVSSNPHRIDRESATTDCFLLGMHPHASYGEIYLKV